jgi:hypothetical protein
MQIRITTNLQLRNKTGQFNVPRPATEDYAHQSYFCSYRQREGCKSYSSSITSLVCVLVITENSGLLYHVYLEQASRPYNLVCVI